MYAYKTAVYVHIYAYKTVVYTYNVHALYNIHVLITTVWHTTELLYSERS